MSRPVGGGIRLTFRLDPSASKMLSPSVEHRLTGVLSDHQVVQDLVDSSHAAGQVANVLIRVALQHAFETDPVWDPANNERCDAKAGLRTKPAMHGLFEPVGRINAPGQKRLAVRQKRLTGRLGKNA
jgi:hypothetical protein